jgi:carbon monoxide dehydrogenase subunit G
MEHEVFIPVSAETLRQTLRDPQRVARCVPGLQQDADAEASPLSGRLKVRIGGHSITYRGTLTLVERKGVFTAEGEGAEARGTGMAGLKVTLRLKKTRGGTTLVFTAESRAEGRLADVPAETAAAAAHRLLDRFAARLKEESSASGLADTSDEPAQPNNADAASDPLPVQPAPTVPDAEAADNGVPGAGAGTDAGAAADAHGDVDGGDDGDAGADPADPDAADGPDADESDESDSVSDPAVPSPSLRGQTASAEGDFLVPDDPAEPPAEAAHARRTMIGRSAEEVDHAPPRGRYAPVPAPEAAGAGATLRWVAPAAALALASAVVVGRALRRRK